MGSQPVGAGHGPQIRRHLRRWGIASLLALGFAVPVLVRVWFEGHRELAEASAARDVDDIDAEIAHLGRALRWRLPLAQQDVQALSGLWTIGKWAERHGQGEQALAAYREVRRGLLGSRSLWVSHEDDLTQANDAIARLMAEQQHAYDPDSTPQEELINTHRELLSVVPGPAPGSAAAAALAFVLWVVASTGFLYRGIDAQGHVVRGAATRWGLVSLGSLLAWIALFAHL